ncbi:MAG TPA: CheR family methyltransferase [Spirochaetia bacterium]|nr:CheR family methyltransferase [Spirochaetia bacterium]
MKVKGSTSIGETTGRTEPARRRNNRAAETEQVSHVDFKMVTFSLGGKDYGIDIMKVKEIAKYSHFTYVPNCPPFVRGVYNLRGEIISVIDLRRMFNLSLEKEHEQGAENGLILRLENSLIGVVVDLIDKVVGIATSSIQPPHPIFADINIKYISGVVEHDGRLYIILDVERIFSRDEERVTEPAQYSGAEIFDASVPVAKEATQEPVGSPASRGKASAAAGTADSIGFTFVTETLATFANFFVTSVNREWVEKRFREWRTERGPKKEDSQLTSTDDAQAFLSSFFSPFSDRFWSEDYAALARKLLPASAGTSLNIWNPGCGKGFEAYSLACMVKQQYPKTRLKVWASDKDLLNISTAPNLVFPQEVLPRPWRGFAVSGKNGYSFGAEIKDLVLFEYHDVLHTNTLPDVDLIVARDLISFLNPEDQQKVLDDFYEHLNRNGVLVLGANERIPESDRWKSTGDDDMVAYRKI